MMDKNLVNGFLDRIRTAGGIIREQWTDEKRIDLKGSIDLVTQTDLAVEAYLVKALAELLPSSTVLAEESHTVLEPGELCWIIDPVDGTTNYAHGLPMVAVSVALWREGRAELGAVYAPMLGELFWATREEGAFLNGQRISVSAEADMQNALIATGFPYSVAAEAEAICSRLRRVLQASRGVRRLGSAAIDLAYTACGRFDGFYETSLKPWDTAAGWLLVEEAGGRVSDTDGAPYRFDQPMIVASNGRVHEKLLELLRPQ